MTVLLENTTLSESQFERISKLVKKRCGINLHTGKKELVKARLNKRLRKLGMDSFRTYVDYVEHDASGDELITMLDALSTNLTSFFRESTHFDFLAQKLLPELVGGAAGKKRQLRMWSAGCSSGEEPYTMAIVLDRSVSNLNSWDAKILATDLSTKVLAKAREGVYGHERLKGIPGGLRSPCFTYTRVKPEKLYQVKDHLRKLVHFARLNLLERWPMKGPFDVIFCRNVMIYFDKTTQERLVNRFWELLPPGGVLFIGHSESLAGVQHQFKYVEPTVYRRV